MLRLKISKALEYSKYILKKFIKNDKKKEKKKGKVFKKS